MHKSRKETSTHFSLVNTYTQSISNELTVNDVSNVDLQEPLLLICHRSCDCVHIRGITQVLKTNSKPILALCIAIDYE